MKYASLLAGLIACGLLACTVTLAPRAPARTNAPQEGCGDQSEVYPGFAIKAPLEWTCQEYGEGWSSDPAAVCDTAIADIQTTCQGTPCTATVRGPDTLIGPYTWRRPIEVVAHEPGPLRIQHDVMHRNGVRERMVQACAVVAPPKVTLTCSFRDAATGAFLPCPAVIPEAADVHLAMEATRDIDRRTRDPHIAIIGNKAQPSATERVQCVTEDDGVVAILRCVWSARPGAYLAQVRIRDREVLGELALVVGPTR